MSEQNILNPSASSELNPDWGYKVGDPSTWSKFQPKSGKSVTRLTDPRGRQFQLGWANRPKSIAQQLQQWDRQYRNGFFSYYDIDAGRYYSGNFPSPLTITPQGNDQYTVEGVFEEMMGVALYAYPSGWGTDSIFLEEKDDFGNDAIDKAGTWNFYTSASQHGGTSYYNSLAAEAGVGYAAWKYFGYGFRLWGIREPNGGIADIHLDGAFLASVDFYANPTQQSAALLTKADVPLGEHTVTIWQEGVKNALSGGYYIYADALEFIR